ncbi:phosphoglycolate phosphatase [Bacillus sp. V3-13]|uniref:HAD hydrolase-like protein n=1 Tax=Bacillus sp. V3-13 TaxID=2053728 RepID=UPI000C792967|nr:HAD hydrolase-like protein [Bacillus sp. V3-13]PLR78496.1 phosphoglycolate phosphatase [Bacillus sp. V3-13]
MNILWDFDGTLINTYPAYTKILRETLGNRISEAEAFQQLKVSFSHAFEYFQLTDKQIVQVRSAARNLPANQVMPFPGVEKVLKYANKNVMMTHKERDDVWDILKYYHLDHFFADMVAGDDGFPRKPDPSSYRYLHEKHQIDLAIGDREIDIVPAKILGIKTCLFQNNTPGADYYLESYEDFNPGLFENFK